MLPEGDLFGERTMTGLGTAGPISHPAAATPALTCVYSGVWTQSIPDDLIRDSLLKASEVRIWCVLRTYLKSPTEPVSPTYDELCRAGNMARATLSRSLKVLRLTRWLTSRLQRDAIGLMRGAIYILHDRRLDAGSVMMLDPRYPSFVAQCAIDEADDRVRKVAMLVAEQMPELYKALAPTVPELIEALAIAQSSIFESPTARSPAIGSATRPADDNRSLRTELPTSARSSVLEPPAVQHERSSCSALFFEENQKKTTTTGDVVAKDEWSAALHWPPCIQDRGLATQFLGELPAQLRPIAQDLLDELQGQHSAGRVSRPLAYLGGLVRKAKSGTFKITENTTNARRRRQRELEIAADHAALQGNSFPGARA